MVADREVLVAARVGAARPSPRACPCRPPTTSCACAGRRAGRRAPRAPAARRSAPRRARRGSRAARAGSNCVAEERVELLLVARRGRPRPSRRSSTPYSETESPARTARLAERDVVLLRAGEVLEQVAVATRAGRRAGRSAGRRARRTVAFVSPSRDDLHDPRQLREPLGQGGRVGGGRDDVEVAERLACAGAREPASETRSAAAMRAQRLDDRGTAGSAAAEQRPVARVRPSPPRRAPAGRFSSTSRRARRASGAAAARRPSRSSASVVTPSSFQIRAAVFGPRPGRRMKRRLRAGSPPCASSSACDLAVVDDLDDLLLDRLADPRELLRLALERRAPRPSPAVSRIALAARRYAGRGRPLALELEQVAEQVELRRDVGVPRKPRHALTAMISPVRATVCLPTYNERENLERDGARARRGPARRRRRARDRRQLAGRHGRDRRPPRGRARRASTCSTARGRRGSAPRTSPASGSALADGAELVLEMDCDFSHDPADVPRLIAAAADGADLVLGSRYVAGGGTGELGPRSAARLARRVALRADPARRRASATSPAASSASAGRCSRRSTSTRSTRRGYAFQIETTYRALRAGFRVVEVPIAFVDREEGGSKMSARDRARGGLEGAAAPARGARRGGCDARGVRRRARRPSAGRASSTSGRRGASRARRSSRSSRRCRSPSSASTSTTAPTWAAASACSRSRRCCCSRGARRRPRCSARSRASFERAFAACSRRRQGRPARLRQRRKWSHPPSSTGSPARRSSTPSPSSQRPITAKSSGSGRRGEQLEVLAEADVLELPASGTRSRSITQRTPDRRARWPASRASPSEMSSIACAAAASRRPSTCAPADGRSAPRGTRRRPRRAGR